MNSTPRSEPGDRVEVRTAGQPHLPKPGSLLAIMLTLIASLALLYLASTGPLVYLTGRGVMTSSFWETVYTPALWLDGHCGPYHHYLSWWAELSMPRR